MEEEEKTALIPYYVHEGELNRMERVVKKLWIALLVLFLAFVGTNVGWIIYESQFETYLYEQELQTDTGNAVGLLNTGEGDVIYNGDSTEAARQDQGEATVTEGPDEALPDL